MTHLSSTWNIRLSLWPFTARSLLTTLASEKGRQMDTLHIKHLLVRTPFERPAKWLQEALATPYRLRHPELRQLHREPDHVERLIRRLVRANSNCIDVGCHLGLVLSRMVRLAPQGRHMAFEPVPRKAAWLREKFPEVDVHQVALSESAGSVIFYEDQQRSGYSGLARPARSRVLSYVVRTAALDDLVGLCRVDFIKVDVEGAELHVLRGATQLLRRDTPPILFESAPDKSGAGKFGYRAADLFRYLTDQMGYLVFNVGDFLAGATHLALKEFLASHQYPFRAMNYLAISGTEVRTTSPLDRAFCTSSKTRSVAGVSAHAVLEQHPAGRMSQQG